MQITIVAYYLLVVNVLSFILYGIDKLKAKCHRWRIPENVLLLSSAVGGSVGSLCAMFLFRHKTQHKKFTILVPLFLFAQLAVVCYFGLVA